MDETGSSSPALGLAFVGRASELATLRAAFADACAGRGRLVLLSGEPGIGKTRTCEELAAYARSRGARVLWGRCYEGEGAPAFWPWVQVLRVCVTHLDYDALRDTLGAGAADIAQMVPAIRERLPELLSPAASDSPEARFALFDGIVRFLGRVAQPAPLVIILDDLHGADGSSLLLLEFVARALRELPLLVLGTYRDVGALREHPLTEMAADLVREPATERLDLHGLSAADVAQFVEASAGVKPPPDLVTRLHRRTEGNPLFVGEFVRVLLTQHGASAVRDPRSAIALAVPRGVRAVIERRLAPLSAGCRNVLQVAAVIGREFGAQLLASVLLLVGTVAAEAQDAALAEALEEAEEAGIVGDMPESPRRRRFAHALIRETLYEAVPPAERAQLHRHVAEAIERLPDADDHLAELAYHFFVATGDDSGAKAARYAQRAGARAMQLLAFEEAVRLYELGLQALERGSGLASPAPEADRLGADAQRCELLLGLGEAQNGVGKTAQSKEAVLGAADIARRLGLREHFSRAALAFGLQFAFGEAGVTDQTLVSLLEEAIQCWGAEDSALHARLLGRLALALYFAPGEPRRTSLGDAAVRMARRTGDDGALAFVLHAKHAADWGPDNQTERIAIASELAQLARRSGDRYLVFQAYFWRANDSLELGDFDAFDADLDTCARLVEELRQPYHRFHVELFQAARAAILGRFDDAQRLAAAAYTSGMKWHEAAAQQFSAAHALSLALLSGEPLDGFVAFMGEAIAQHLEVPGLGSFLAYIYAELGREAPARREFNQLAAADFADSPRDAGFIPTLGVLSATCTFLGDAARAAILYELLKPYAARAAVLNNIGCILSMRRTLPRNAGGDIGTLGRCRPTLQRCPRLQHAHACAAPCRADTIRVRRRPPRPRPGRRSRDRVQSLDCRTPDRSRAGDARPRREGLQALIQHSAFSNQRSAIGGER